MFGLFNRSAQKQELEKDRTERRRLPRAITKRAVAVVDGVNLPLANWNVKGFLATKYHGNHMVGTRIPTRLIIPGRSGILSFASDGVIVRISRRQSYIAVMFVDMHEPTRDKVLRYIAKNRNYMKWDRPS